MLASCGGAESAPTTAPPPSAPAAEGTATGPSTVEGRLASAGFHAVATAPAAGSGAKLSLTTGSGSLLVYIIGFETADAAVAYAKGVAATAERSPGQIVARRVGTRVYTGVAAERPDAVAKPAPLLKVIKAVEGAGVRPIRVSPR